MYKFEVKFVVGFINMYLSLPQSFKMKHIYIFLAIAIAAVLYRLIPHPMNFSPLNALFLFGGVVVARKYWKYIVGLFVIVFISDFILNNTIQRAFFSEPGIIWFPAFMLFNYIAYLFMVGVGRLTETKLLNVVLGALSCSMIFFILTNTSAWLFDPMNLYPNNFMGLVAAWVAGLPFLQATIISDVFFAGIFFGLYEMSKSIFGMNLAHQKA